MKKPAFVIFLSLSLIFMMTTCNLTTENFWSGDSNVNGRFSGLLDLTEADPEVSCFTETCAGTYEVLMLTDVHVGAKFYSDDTAQAFYKWLEAYDSSNVRFACALGDFADHAKEDEMRSYAQIVSVIEEKWGIKVLSVIGNHDLFTSSGYDLFCEYCYPFTSYYRFETGSFAWYALDSGSGTLGSRQLENLRLSLSDETKIPVILTHVPLQNEGKWHETFPFCLRDTTERNILINLFNEKKVPAYFCGHFHAGDTRSFGTVTQFDLRSFGEFGEWHIIQVDEGSVASPFTVKSFLADDYK